MRTEPGMARMDRRDDLAAAVAAGAAAALGELLAPLRESVQTLGDDRRHEAALRRMEGLPASALRRGERLVGELLAYAGRQELAPARVEPLAFLLSLADRVRGALGDRFEVKVEVERECAACRADPRALEDALVDLVVNGRDAMPHGGCLGLSAQDGCRLADGSPSVAFSVSDSGVGMTAEVAERAAWPFFTTKRNAPWAGMGLAAVQGFAIQSGGSMAVRSSPHAGTTVTLYLPRHDGAEPGGKKRPP